MVAPSLRDGKDGEFDKLLIVDELQFVVHSISQVLNDAQLNQLEFARSRT